MKRIWLAVALLAASWLFGVDYYHKAEGLFWWMLLAGGTAFCWGYETVRFSRVLNMAALVLLFPAALAAPAPYAVILWMLWAGFALAVIPVPVRWPGKLAQALLISGMILLFQWIALTFYQACTAGAHEVPSFLTGLIGGLAGLLGIDAGILAHNLALFTMRKTHVLGITWELLLDPVTFLFFTGSLVVLLHQYLEKRAEGHHLRSLALGLLKLGLCLLVWLPLRTVLHLTILGQRFLVTGYDDPLVIMNQFWNQWIHLGLLAAPVLFCLLFIPVRRSAGDQGSGKAFSLTRHSLLAGGLAGVSLFLLLSGFFWEPAGRRKAGHVRLDAYHSTWEPVDKPFDTTWYGQDSGYNYWCLYQYLSHYYSMSVQDKPLTAEQLKTTDVLIVKVPTSPYTQQEIAAVGEFVKNGGGLLLVGEHTDVFKTTTYINDLAKPFGFEFEKDILLSIDTTFEQLYVPPFMAHPITQNMPPLNFAVSCSINAPPFSGNQVIRSTGLRRLYADYHVSNFYPAVEDYSDVRYGAFTQLFEKTVGKGRVVAFTDSTIFSNFSTFEPGKIELLTGMVEWLNHTPVLQFLKVILMIAGFLCLVFSGFLVWKHPQPWLLLLVCLILGSAAGSVTARAVNRASFPLPQPHSDYVQVNIDRALSTVPLSASGFIKGEENGFGIFEQWILRLGYYTKRPAAGKEFDGDLLVFFYPEKTVPAPFREKLVEYVRRGGRLLIIDSAANRQSSANSLLYPFGIGLSAASPLAGDINTLTEDSSTLYVENVLSVKGGVPFLNLGYESVGAHARFGKGTVTVLGIGTLFTDARMGVTADVVPDASLQKVFDFEFDLIRAVAEDRLPDTVFRTE